MINFKNPLIEFFDLLFGNTTQAICIQFCVHQYDLYTPMKVDKCSDDQVQGVYC